MFHLIFIDFPLFSLLPYGFGLDFRRILWVLFDLSRLSQLFIDFHAFWRSKCQTVLKSGGHREARNLFFSPFFVAKCQTVLKIEGVTRSLEVDFWTPLQCFFFQKLARRVSGKQVSEQKGTLGGHFGPIWEPGGRLGASKNAIENKADIQVEKGACTMLRIFSGRPKCSQKRCKTHFFFRRFSDALLDWFFVDFRFQVGSENPPKSNKNRCQDAFPCWLHFLMDFWSIFAPNLDPLNPNNL